MDNIAFAMFVGIFLATIFGIIYTVYFVKIARRLCFLLQHKLFESDRKYDLPPPMPLQKGKFSTSEE